jgi:hypothetical protein
MSGGQADGSYPRLNGDLLATGRYTNMIVSMVGRFVSHFNHATMSAMFECCDQKRITMTFEGNEAPDVSFMNGPPVEVVGMVQTEDKVTVCMQQCPVYNALISRLVAVLALIHVCTIPALAYLLFSPVLSTFVYLDVVFTVTVLCLSRAHNGYRLVNLQQDACCSA